MDPVRAHERRLRAAFRRVLLLALVPSAALQGCGDDVVTSSHEPEAGDATAAEDGRARADGAAFTDGPAEAADAADATLQNADAQPDSESMEAAEDRNEVTDAVAGDAGDSGESGDAELDSSAPWCADASVGAPYWLDSGNCRYFVDLSCAQYPPVGNCLLSAGDCSQLCTLSTPLFDCEYAPPACTLAGKFVADAGQPVTVQCDVCPSAGRRPAGLRRPAWKKARSVLGQYLAQAAHFEAASVIAFERLVDELRSHRAPRRLIEVAARSAIDEIRHARVMGALAMRHGSAAPKPRIVATSGPRSLESLARENAIEGCVRETYGAALATWQASRAEDPAIRRSLERVAADETRHAALAWAIADWADEHLDARGRGRVARARDGALRRLRAEISREPHPSLARRAGLPSAEQAVALLDGAVLGLLGPKDRRRPSWRRGRPKPGRSPDPRARAR